MILDLILSRYQTRQNCVSTFLSFYVTKMMDTRILISDTYTAWLNQKCPDFCEKFKRMLNNPTMVTIRDLECVRKIDVETDRSVSVHMAHDITAEIRDSNPSLGHFFSVLVAAIHLK